MPVEEKGEKSLTELIELARPAARALELVEIARTATSNTKAKDIALELGVGEELAKSCRWLRIVKTKNSIKFEGLIDQEKPEERKQMAEEEKNLKQIEFALPDECSIISTKYHRNLNGRWVTTPIKEDQIIIRVTHFEDFETFLGDLLSKLVGHDQENGLRDLMAKILEEKYGLKLKVCGNCANFIEGSLVHYEGHSQQKCLLPDPPPSDFEPDWENDGLFASCPYWEIKVKRPKEVSKPVGKTEPPEKEEIKVVDICPEPNCGTEIRNIYTIGDIDFGEIIQGQCLNGHKVWHTRISPSWKENGMVDYPCRFPGCDAIESEIHRVGKYLTAPIATIRCECGHTYTFKDGMWRFVPPQESCALVAGEVKEDSK